MADGLFQQLLNRLNPPFDPVPTPSKDPRVAEAKDYVSDSPSAIQVLRDPPTVYTDKESTDRMARESRDWNAPYGRSFASPFFNSVNMAPDEPAFNDTFAHELGHIAQGRNEISVKNDDSADFIKRELEKTRQVRRNIYPMPALAIDSNAARRAMDFGAIPKNTKGREDMIWRSNRELDLDKGISGFDKYRDLYRELKARGLIKE